jgi:hypothetical protein
MVEIPDERLHYTDNDIIRGRVKVGEQHFKLTDSYKEGAKDAMNGCSREYLDSDLNINYWKLNVKQATHGFDNQIAYQDGCRGHPTEPLPPIPNDQW